MSANEYQLSKGAHSSPDDGRCAMEWVAYLAGEPHSDQPECVSPLLREFCVSLNDTLPNEKRQMMRPYLARTIGTAGDGKDQERSMLAVDWLIRVYTPAWLDLVPSLREDAVALRAAAAPVLQMEAVERAMTVIAPAQQRANAAWDAARAAAWDAARAAARAAAWDAARAAARAAAWDAARDVLTPTVEKLQHSVVHDLLASMLPMEIVQLPVVGVDEAERVCGVPIRA